MCELGAQPVAVRNMHLQQFFELPQQLLRRCDVMTIAGQRRDQRLLLFDVAKALLDVPFGHRQMVFDERPVHVR